MGFKVVVVVVVVVVDVVLKSKNYIAVITLDYIAAIFTVH